MQDSGAAAHGRPLCRCHCEPMRSRGPGKGWRCAVHLRDAQARHRKTQKGRASHKRAMERWLATENGRSVKARNAYARWRRELRDRIERKRKRIAELEAFLAEENTG